MAYAWLYYCVLVSATLVLAAENQCSKTINLCKLQIGGNSSIQMPSKGPKGAKGDIGDPGQKGEPGNAGPQGLPGSDGLPGQNGVKGSTGPQGPPGYKGDIGDPGPSASGFPGSPGSKGETGDQGVTGLSGNPGLVGNPGQKGVKGIAGPIGPPGNAGTPGHCVCNKLGDEEIYNIPYEEISFGKEDDPADQVCKFSTETLETNIYYLGPGPMNVTCITRRDQNLTTLTCIPPHNATKIDIDENPHWLSQKNFTIEDMYGINRTQIEWLHSSSVSAFQTIRFHCLNINPFPRDNVENSTRLLTWNENSIGPMPTLTKPFFYSIDTDRDGCSKATDDEWSYTDIKLVSEAVRRVPVIDFYISDIRPGKKQAVQIENYELCFD